MTNSKKLAGKIGVAATFAAIALFAVSSADVAKSAGQDATENGAAQNAPGATSTTGASAAPATTDSVAALRARISSLQATLQNAPTSVEEQVAQQRTLADIAGLQAELQRREAVAGQFSSYRQARDAQVGLAGADVVGSGSADASGLYAPNARIDALNASGLGVGANPYNLGGAVVSPGEAALLREQKSGLTQQYRQLQQTLRALQPGDEALAENLKREQETILAQLKDIDARLLNAPAETTEVVAPNADANFTLPETNRLVLNGAATDNVMEKMQKANQAATLLREAGLVQLAGRVTTEIPRMADPNFTETSLVEGTWAQNSGLADEENNPFHTVSPKDVQGIRDSIDDLKSRVDALSQTLSDVETQLKLLTRQQVSGYIDQPRAATTRASEQTSSQDAEKQESNVPDDSVGSGEF